MRHDAMVMRPLTRKRKPTVEAVERRLLLTTYAVTNNADSGVGSLRQAIVNLNATGGASNSIVFSLPSGVQTIAVTSPLPTITAPVTIDGTSQNGYAGTPLIVLSGTGAVSGSGNGTTVDGLDIAAGNSTVRGLVINGFSGEGIALSKVGGNTITGNYLGTDATGTVAVANGLDGITVLVNSNNNVISNNLISGNNINGIYLNGTNFGATNPATSGNLIVGNKIGVDLTGTKALGNGINTSNDGIFVANAPNTVIGGTDGASTRNIISGNEKGIELYDNSDNSVIEGNYIGTDVTGTVAIANPNAGIVLRGISNSTIGGLTPAAANVISGNRIGIDSFVIGSGNLNIEGNLIGTDATGMKALGNTSEGVVVSGETNVTVGGTAPGAGNVISANGDNGIREYFNAAGLVIQGNKIGTAIDGVTPLGNAASGINVSVSGVVVGGTAAGAGNIIANNGSQNPFDRSGVAVTSGTKNVPILGNSIYNNKLYGIEDQNNPVDQAAPVLTSAVSAGNTSTIAGTLTTADGAYVLQFFSTPTLNPSGHAEGKTLLGSTSVIVTGGSHAFNVTLTAGFDPGSYVTATATSVVSGTPMSTSPFSAALGGSGSGPNSKPPTFTVSAPSSVALGGTLTEVFTIANNSTLADSGVAFFDPIPANTAFVAGSSSTGAAVSAANGVIAATIGTLAPGASATVTVVLRAQAGSAPSITNTASVTATSPGVATGQDTASATTAVTTTTDLGVTVAGPSGAVPAGSTVVYTVTVTNQGPATALNVQVADTLPSGVTLVSATSSDGTTVSTTGNASGVAETIATLAANASVTLTITVATSGGTPGSITNTTTVASPAVDSNPDNNSASLTTTIAPSADLGVRNDASPAPFLVGDTITLTAHVTNSGPSGATGVVLVFALPAGVAFVSGTAAGGLVTATNGVVTAPVGAIASGAEAVVSILVRATVGGALTVTDGVAGGQADPTSGNNGGSFGLAVTPVSDLGVQVAGPAGPIIAGQPLTYTAVVTNAGPSPDTGVVLASPLPIGATFLAASVNGVRVGAVTGSTVNVPIGFLAAGQSVTFTFAVLPAQAGPVALAAAVAGDVPDANPANNVATVNPTVTSASDLGVQVAGPAGPIVVGQPLTYTATVTNTGPSADTGVLLVSPLFAGATFLAASVGGVGVGSVAGNIVNVPIGALGAGQSLSVTFTVLPAQPGTFGASVAVAGDGRDVNPANNVATVGATVTTASDLAVAFAGPPAPGIVGQPLTYTTLVTNVGPSPDTGVVLASPLPAGAAFLSSSIGGVAVGSVAGNVINVPLGALAAGQSVAVTFSVLPAQAGTISLAAAVAGGGPDPNPVDNVANTIVSVSSPAAPVSTIGFSTASYTVDKQAGTATITFNRVGDLSQAVTASFSTTGGTAIAGRDYLPVAAVVRFAPNVASATATIPILPGPSNNPNALVNLTLADPSNATLPGGAATASAQLRIEDTAPILFGPTIPEVKLIGPASGIAGIELDFSEALDPTAATNPANYTLTASPSASKGALAGGTVVPVATAAYDPTNHAVLLTPTTPLPSNQFFLIDVNGSRPGAVTDVAGNPLYSSIPAAATGSDYLLSVARGNDLRLTDQNGTAIRLKLAGPGVVDIDQTTSGLVGRVQILGTNGKSTLSGSASRPTNLGVVGSLGHFRKSLSPLPRPYRSFGTFTVDGPVTPTRIAPVDTLTTPTPTKKPRGTVHARAVATVPTTLAAQHPHGAATRQHSPR